MKKKVIAALLMAAMSVSLLTGCHNSNQTATIDVKETAYDPKEAVKDFEFGELSEEEKDYVIEMGFNNCDHMVAAIIGEKAGIYEAMGLKVNLTKSGETAKSIISGAMDVGYMGTSPRMLAQNPPFFIAAANHVGGSRYLVVNNDIKDAKDLLGKRIAQGPDLKQNAEWCNWAKEYGLSINDSDYELISMSQPDAVFALKAGQIDGFVC